MLDIACKDTITAIATAQAPSAIAVVRVSGPRALEICQKHFEAKFQKSKNQSKPFVATLGDLKSNSGKILDEVLCTYFPDKRSYTGESSFEVSLHGNPQLAREVVDNFMKSGCRLAEPGEFTFRAVANKKIDLSQAEAIESLIHSKTSDARDIALKNLKGGLSQTLAPVRKDIIEVLAEIESRLDFPDEDLGHADTKHLKIKLASSKSLLEKLLASAQIGKKITEGVRIVLCGAPNAGKSTLLNTLLEQDRAIVHHIAGTTRDVLEAETVIGALPVKLIDVAGIHKSSESNTIDTVEQIGIDRAYREFEKADLILNLQDSSQKNKIIDFEFNKNTPVLSILTKSDLTQSNSGFNISAKTGHGIAELKSKIEKLLLTELPEQSEVYLTKERQISEVSAAHKSLQIAFEKLVNKSEHEIIAFELRESGLALDRLLGTTLGEDVLDLIFSKFCIGK